LTQCTKGGSIDPVRTGSLGPNLFFQCIANYAKESKKIQLTVGNSPVVCEMSRQVLPTVPSPTTVILRGLFVTGWRSMISPMALRKQQALET